MPSSKPVVFGEDAAKRVAAATKRVESQPYDFTGQGRGPRNWNPGVVEARVTTGITQASSSAYGTGEAQIQIDDGSGNFIDDPAYPAPVTVLNYSKTSGTVAATTHIMIGWRNAGWRLVSRDC